MHATASDRGRSAARHAREHGGGGGARLPLPASWTYSFEDLCDDYRIGLCMLFAAVLKPKFTDLFSLGKEGAIGGEKHIVEVGEVIIGGGCRNVAHFKPAKFARRILKDAGVKLDDE